MHCNDGFSYKYISFVITLRIWISSLDWSQQKLRRGHKSQPHLQIYHQDPNLLHHTVSGSKNGSVSHIWCLPFLLWIYLLLESTLQWTASCPLWSCLLGFTRITLSMLGSVVPFYYSINFLSFLFSPPPQLSITVVVLVYFFITHQVRVSASSEISNERLGFCGGTFESYLQKSVDQTSHS